MSAINAAKKAALAAQTSARWSADFLAGARQFVTWRANLERAARRSATSAEQFDLNDYGHVIKIAAALDRDFGNAMSPDR